jgi:hypothetical protein
VTLRDAPCLNLLSQPAHKVAFDVILSEAKNLSACKAEEKERFFVVALLRMTRKSLSPNDSGARRPPLRFSRTLGGSSPSTPTMRPASASRGNGVTHGSLSSTRASFSLLSFHTHTNSFSPNSRPLTLLQKTGGVCPQRLRKRKRAGALRPRPEFHANIIAALPSIANMQTQAA